jgi:hypothetical protein
MKRSLLLLLCVAWPAAAAEFLDSYCAIFTPRPHPQVPEQVREQVLFTVYSNGVLNGRWQDFDTSSWGYTLGVVDLCRGTFIATNYFPGPGGPGYPKPCAVSEGRLPRVGRTTLATYHEPGTVHRGTVRIFRKQHRLPK